jgi:hypothetical protein
VDAGFVLEALIDSDVYLGCKTVTPGVDGSTNDEREPGVDQGLPADDGEHARALRVAGGVPHPIKVATLHTSAW